MKVGLATVSLLILSPSLDHTLFAQYRKRLLALRAIQSTLYSHPQRCSFLTARLLVYGSLRSLLTACFTRLSRETLRKR